MDLDEEESDTLETLLDLSLEKLLETQIAVTATRRKEDLFTIPFNITAYNEAQLTHYTNLLELSYATPGLNVLDQGRRKVPWTTMRGINTTPTGPFFGLADGSGTVGIYFDEIPLYADFVLKDIERVEALIGPQGTLYGSGTLSGGIRYIAKKPQFTGNEFKIESGFELKAESEEIGYQNGVIANWVVLDNLSVRASVYQISEAGFIDYNYLVQEPGISSPEINFNDAIAVRENLRDRQDANESKITSSRIAIHKKMSSDTSVLFTHLSQSEAVGGRNSTQFEAMTSEAAQLGLVPGRYENAYRISEPSKKNFQLNSVNVDHSTEDFAMSLNVGHSLLRGREQRDQTDVLLNFEIGYENFPQFVSVANDNFEQELTSVEFRLDSSPTKSKWRWLTGLYYSDFKFFLRSIEYVPGYPEFIAVNRPDNIEFVSEDRKSRREIALYGELTYQFNDKLEAVIGTRRYRYDDTSSGGFALPLDETIAGAGPDEINLNTTENSVEDDGSLYKFSLSYKISSDFFSYASFSNGYRIGGVNGVRPCTPEDIGDVQVICALENEEAFRPDTVDNFELGLRLKTLDSTLELHVSLFKMLWQDIQIRDETVNGAVGITINGGDASSEGIELQSDWALSSHLHWILSASYIDATLKNDFSQHAAFAGDRLPGTPRSQASSRLNYFLPLGSSEVLLSYGFIYQGSMLSTIGARDQGEEFASYVLHNAHINVNMGQWGFHARMRNLFDKYVFTSARRTQEEIRDITDDTGNRLASLRRYTHHINEPRTFTLTFYYNF